MRTPDALHDYQKKAINFQATHPSSALWLDMGLGKTVITLSSIAHLLGTGYLKGILIVAPIRVIHMVWRQEAMKWEHTKHLKFSRVTGTKDQRTRALLQDADVYLINYENLRWLAETLDAYFINKDRPMPFDGIVWDECFPADVTVSTPNFDISISNVKIGDIVDTHLGPRRVINTMKKSVTALVTVALSNGTTIRCTPNHPFMANGEWVVAEQLSPGDIVYEKAQHSTVWARQMSNLWNGVLETQGKSVHLLKRVCQCMENAATAYQTCYHHRWNQGSAEASRRAWGMEQGETLVRRNAIKDERVSQKERLFPSQWWKWNWWLMGGKFIKNCVARAFQTGIHFKNTEENRRNTNSLQNRFRRPGEEGGHRSSGSESYHQTRTGTGQEETGLPEFTRVVSIVYHEYPSGVDVWNLHVEEAETYFANGVLVHNCSKMKNSATKRVTAVRKILKAFKWKTGLTGTPASNGYKDLHGQFLVLDEGARLGTSKTAFKERFYYKVSQYREAAYPDTEATIQNLIGDITLQMAAEDYNPLPDLMVNDVMLDLPSKLRSQYESLEKQFFFELDNGRGIEVFNSASMTNKTLQFVNGSVYPVAGMPLWEPVHDLKLEALEDIIEEASGQPVLCAYAYRSDAERILHYFKKLRPINLTDCKSEKSLSVAMARWKEGDCPLMIGHPACLHADTQVLTQRNRWVKIIDVQPDDLVFDGTEFVSHGGCSYSGYKEVITVFGITMTPDHKMLINDEWVEAQCVEDTGDVRRAAVYRGQIPDTGESAMRTMRMCDNHAAAERHQTQQSEAKSLFSMCGGSIPQDDRDSDLAHLVWDDKSGRGYIRLQELRQTWHRCLQRVVGFRNLLQRYARWVRRQFDHRAHRQQWSVLQGKLSLGHEYGAAGQQTQQSCTNVPRRTDTPSGVMQTFWFQQNDAEYEIESRHDGRRSSGGRSEVTIRKVARPKEREASATAHVYDLVNCGPRHRFLIRNDEGEMFISHNSMLRSISSR
jgi:hypothetical protein